MVARVDSRYEVLKIAESGKARLGDALPDALRTANHRAAATVAMESPSRPAALGKQITAARSAPTPVG